MSDAGSGAPPPPPPPGGGAPPPPPGGQPPPPGGTPPPGGWGPPPGGYAPPPGGGWPQQQPPQQQIVVKQGPGCLKIGLIVAGVLVLFGFGLVACLAFAGNEVANEIDDAMGTASSDDYEITGETCGVDEFLGAEAAGTIENTSDKAQGFQIEVRFETSDGKLVGESSTFTDTIAVGQSQDYEVSTLEQPAEGEELTCTITEVSYTIFDDEEGN